MRSDGEARPLTVAALPVTASCRPPAGGEEPFVFAPWLAAVPAKRADLLAMLPVLDINGTLTDALRAPAATGERRDLAIAAFLAVDPFLRVQDFARCLAASGVRAVTNFPSIQLVDGEAARTFASAGVGFAREVEVLRALRLRGFAVTAFCTSLDHAIKARDAGAECLVLHPGLALADWRARAASALALARVAAALRREATAARVLVYRPAGFGAELEVAIAAAHGVAGIAEREGRTGPCAGP